MRNLLTTIDANRYGLVPDLACEGAPHPDAVAIGKAVMALDRAPLVAPGDWHPRAKLDFGDVGQPLLEAWVARALDAMTVRDAAGQRTLPKRPPPIVIRWARAKVGRPRPG